MVSAPPAAPTTTAPTSPRAPTTGPRAQPSQVDRLAAAWIPALVALWVVINAWPGLMPVVGFWDTGEFQAVLPLMGTAHPTGYPTYVLLGWVGNLLLTPMGEPAYRISALSLIAVAIAAAATVALVRRLTGSTIIGAAAGIGLATTSLVWQNATRADPHPIHLAFVALLLLALVRWADGPHDGLDRRETDRRLVLAAVVFGLAVGNHSLTLLLVPPIALYVVAVEPAILRRPRFVAACLGAAALTIALVFLELPIRSGLVPATLVYGRPATWDGFWYIALAEQFRGSLGDVFGNLGDKVFGRDGLLAIATRWFGPFLLLVPIAVVVAAIRAPRLTLLTGSAMVITLLFNQSYSNAEIERYYLGPVLWIWLWLAILAAEVAAIAVRLLASWLPPRAAGTEVAAGGRRRVEVLAAAIVAVVLLIPAATELDARRRQADRSGSIEAQVWLDEALPVLEPNAVIVSWWSTSTPLWYAQKVEGRIPGVYVVDDRTMLDDGLGRAPDVIRRFLAEGRPVYAIRIDGPDLNELKAQFDMTRVASTGHTAVWKVNGYGVTLQ